MALFLFFQLLGMIILESCFLVAGFSLRVMHVKSSFEYFNIKYSLSTESLMLYIVEKLWSKDKNFVHVLVR